jgi:hypothetical protein
MTDYTVTLYKLFLGDQDAVTGHYQVGYTIHSAEVAIFPRSEAPYFTGIGKYTHYSFIGFTEYNLEEGDVILAQDGRYYEVRSVPPWTPNNLSFFALGLELLEVFPFIAGFFGFEDLEHGTIGFGFEDGFERGWFAL